MPASASACTLCTVPIACSRQTHPRAAGRTQISAVRRPSGSRFAPWGAGARTLRSPHLRAGESCPLTTRPCSVRSRSASVRNACAWCWPPTRRWCCSTGTSARRFSPARSGKAGAPGPSTAFRTTSGRRSRTCGDSRPATSSTCAPSPRPGASAKSCKRCLHKSPGTTTSPCWRRLTTREFASGTPPRHARRAGAATCSPFRSRTGSTSVRATPSPISRGRCRRPTPIGHAGVQGPVPVRLPRHRRAAHGTGDRAASRGPHRALPAGDGGRIRLRRLVQQTTAEYLEERLGWHSVYAYNTETFGPDDTGPDQRGKGSAHALPPPSARFAQSGLAGRSRRQRHPRHRPGERSWARAWWAA